MDQIVLKHVSFNYSKHKVFNEINLRIKEGWTSIVGPNGAGKSTMMNMMNGLLKPGSGQVYILGKNLQQLPTIERAKLFTTIHQQRNMNFPMTCFDLVSQGRFPMNGGRHHLMEEDYKVIYEIMKETQTYEFKEQLVTQLSGGEKQRVLLALALVQEPKILFIDEGFSALDIKHKREIIKCLKKRVKKQNLVVIAIIHDLNIAYQVSNQVLLINNQGEIQVGQTRKMMTKETIENLYDTRVKYHEEYGFSMSM